MEPILRRHFFSEMPAPEYLLTNQCDQHRMFGVVVKGVTVGDNLDGKAPGGIQNFRVGRLQRAKYLSIS